jgi:hypothetical protein
MDIYDEVDRRETEQCIRSFLLIGIMIQLIFFFTNPIRLHFFLINPIRNRRLVIATGTGPSADG